jgi:hypothetical protein
MSSTKFLESLGSKLAEQWVVTILTPSFLFWGGGLLALMDKYGWVRFQVELVGLPEPLQIAVLGAALLLVAVSALAVQRFDLPVLRFLEGYWPRWSNALQRLLVRRQEKRLASTEAHLNELRAREETRGLTPDESEELTRLEWWRRFMPSQASQLMPTRLGNILRSAERRPQEKYGLDAVVCWPHLWFLLPESTKLDLQNARASLNNIAQLWLWSILFLFWTPSAWWALPIGLLVAFFSYGWMLEAAEGLSTLVEAAYDLHRMTLYQAMNWPLPVNSDQELKLGQQLSEYLWRGPVRGPIVFTYPEKRGSEVGSAVDRGQR